jgi:hypothetical protein
MKGSTALRLVCRKPAELTEIRFVVQFSMSAQGKVLEVRLLGMMGLFRPYFTVLGLPPIKKNTGGLGWIWNIYETLEEGRYGTDGMITRAD